ncbi:MAG: protein YgfX [Oceanospirillum sp.]|nr:protein YgfX [Oceanospirillum sp.]
MPSTAIFLTLKASEQLRGWLIASHVFPLSLLFWLRPEPLSLLFLLPAFFFWWQAHKALGLSGRGDDISGIAFSDDRWTLKRVSGETLPVDLVSSSGFYSVWLLLVFRDDDRKTHRVFVARDSTDEQSFRKLRVLLRFISKRAGFRF